MSRELPLGPVVWVILGAVLLALAAWASRRRRRFTLPALLSSVLLAGLVTALLARLAALFDLAVPLLLQGLGTVLYTLAGLLLAGWVRPRLRPGPGFAGDLVAWLYGTVTTWAVGILLFLLCAG